MAMNKEPALPRTETIGLKSKLVNFTWTSFFAPACFHRCLDN